MIVFGLVPGRDTSGERAEDQEDHEAEEGGEDHRAVEHLGLEPPGIDVDELADPRLALLEEEVADDGADHGRAGGYPQSREDRGQRGRELELDKPGEPAGTVQAEQ